MGLTVVIGQTQIQEYTARPIPIILKNVMFGMIFMVINSFSNMKISLKAFNCLFSEKTILTAPTHIFENDKNYISQ